MPKTTTREQELLRLIANAERYGNTAFVRLYEAELRALTKGKTHA